MQDRTATGSDRVDQHHGRAHAHPGNLGLEGALVFAVIVGDIGRRAAHVKADNLFKPGHRAGFDRADHTACRTRQDRVLALEHVSGSKAAVRLHEHELATRVFRIEFTSHLFDIAPEDR